MKKYLQQASLILIGLSLAVGSSYLYAWTGPSQTAPAGNVAAPLNIGPLTQSKDGILGVNGLGVFGPAYVSETAYSLPGNLLLGINGNIGAKQYCDETGQNCSSSVSGGGGSGVFASVDFWTTTSHTVSTINSQYNIASITPDGSDYFNIQFTTAAPSANYIIMIGDYAAATAMRGLPPNGDQSATGFKLNASTYAKPQRIRVMVYLPNNGTANPTSGGNEGDDLADFKSSYGLSMWPNKLVCKWANPATVYVFSLGGIENTSHVVYKIEGGQTTMSYAKGTGVADNGQPADMTCPTSLHLDGRLLEQ